jgi:hypothetical protein
MYLSSYKKMRGNDRIIQVNSERLNKSVEEEGKKSNSSKEGWER